MVRHALSLFAVCLSITSIALADPPVLLPVPDVSEIWTAIETLEQRVDKIEQAKFAPKRAVVQSSSSKPYAVITIESLPGCQPCNRWKSKEAKELRAVGWTVIEEPLTSSRSAPYFRICVGDKCYTHSGFMPHSVLRSIIGTTSKAAQTARKIVQSARYTTEQLRARIRLLRPGGWRGPVYADVASSYAKQHLCGPEHGFTWEQVAGLTQEEALILHDLAPRHGNQIFPQP